MQFPNLDLTSGNVYAITGPNGCGNLPAFTQLLLCWWCLRFLQPLVAAASSQFRTLRTANPNTYTCSHVQSQIIKWKGTME